MKTSLPNAWLFRKAFFGLAILVLSCHLGQDPKKVNTLTLSKHFETLSQYDSLVIEVKDLEGNLLGIAFEGKVTKSSQLEKLEVAGWNGGPVRIITTGFRKGNPDPVYREEKQYDGTARKTDSIRVHIHPNIGISSPSLSVHINKGQKVTLPRVDITPAHLSDTSLIWISENPNIADIEGSNLVGVSTGTARVTAKLGRDTTKALSFTVYVQSPVTDNPVVTIDAPKDNSYSNRRNIQVAWSVRGIPQDSLLIEDLATVGPNVVTRSVRDSAGMIRTASITVHLDTSAPSKPLLSGASPTNSKPRWIWSTGGGGGSGDFRFQIGNANFPSEAPSTRDTAYTLTQEPVSGTTYTLYVQESDQAGNWSPIESLGILYDVNRPIVDITSPQGSGTHYTTSSGIVLSGNTSGRLPITKVTYRIGTGTAINATFSEEEWSTASISLPEGSPVQVTVTAVDNAGNSGEAVLTLFLDTTQPIAPTFSTVPPAATTSLKGTFGWSPSGDGVNGSGLNGRYRYNLNGGTWKDTTATLIPDFPLMEGNNIFNVQAQDRAQIWSASATRAVRVDTTPPVITLSSHSNPAASASSAITLSGQARDTGTGVATMTVSGQVSGSQIVTVTGSNWTTASLTLATGPNTLVFTATDQLGNARILNMVVNVNLAASRVVITNPSDSLTLTRLDTIRVVYTIDGISGNQRFDLSEGVNRLEVTSAPNASGNIGRDTVKVTRDAIPPRAPNLTAGTTPTNATATWTWSSRGDSANGAGVRNPPVFRYSVNGGAFVETGSNQHLVESEGTYSLVVQEQDRAGNWSPSSVARSIVVDKSGPAIVIQTRNNYITNRPRVYVRYTVEGVAAGPSVCQLTNADTANTCQVSASDNLGNITRESITVWYRPNTWFITENGTGAGTSWDSAASDLGPRVRSEAMVGKELWVATGSYANIGSNIKIRVLGGFDASTFPHFSTNRNLTGTYVDEVFVDYLADISFDGVVFGTVQVMIGKATMTNVQVNPKDSLAGLSVHSGGGLIANNLQIIGKTFRTDIISISNRATAVFNGGSVVNNYSTWNIIHISGPETNVRLSNGFNLYGNTSYITSHQINLMDSAHLTVDDDVNVECWNIQNEGGSGTCKGNPL